LTSLVTLHTWSSISRPCPSPPELPRKQHNTPGEAAAAATAHRAHILAAAQAAAPSLTGPEQGSWLARLDAHQASQPTRTWPDPRSPKGGSRPRDHARS